MLRQDIKPKLKNPYPAIDFEKAYGYLRGVRERFPNKSRLGRKELLEEGLGFPETNGAGHNVVGALGHYNLIRREGSKDQVSYNITPEADRLLHNEDNLDQWAEFALKAVVSPVLFEFLYSKYPDGNIPVGVDSVLIKKYEEVNEKNVRTIIRRYESSLRFVNSKTSTAEAQNKGEQVDFEERAEEKIIEVNIGNGIIMSIPEKTLANIVKAHFKHTI